MADEAAVETVEPEAPTGIDIDKISDQIGAELFDDHRADPEPKAEIAEAIVNSGAPAPAQTTPVVPPVQDLNGPPPSWPKDMHAHWTKVPKEVQTYYQGREKQFLDGLEQYKSDARVGQSINKVLQPYEAAIRAAGSDAPRAVASLLNAHARLTTGSLESRQAAHRDLGERLGITAPESSNGQPATPIDPRIQTLEQQLQRIQQTMTAQQEATLQEAREKANLEVNAFADDPKNAFFDEVHEDLVKFLNLGLSLPDAYEKAVWANPVTREKQMLTRIQTETEKALERKRLDALPKQKARGVNVNGRETSRTPTEPVGTMDDTLRSAFKEIKSRTAH